MTPRLTVPQAVRDKARVEGPACTAWLADLDRLVGDLERHWGIVAGQAATGGTASFICDVRTEDGQPAVLKLVMPAAHDAQAIREWAIILLVENGLLWYQTGDHAVADRNLHVAEAWAGDMEPLTDVLRHRCSPSCRVDPPSSNRGATLAACQRRARCRTPPPPAGHRPGRRPATRSAAGR